MAGDTVPTGTVPTDTARAPDPQGAEADAVGAGAMKADRSLFVGAAVLAVLALAATGWILGDRLLDARTPAGPGLVALPAEIGGPFSLTDHRGEAVTAADFRGGFTLLTFGYRSCPDFCPTTLATMSLAMDRLGPRATRVRPVFLSLDPARDTPDALAAYVAHFHPDMVALTGPDAAVRDAARAFRVIYRLRKDVDPVDYPVDHSTYSYLMDPDWRLLAVFRHDVTPETMTEVVEGFF